MKGQSATEYLLTYGWGLLIVALGAAIFFTSYPIYGEEAEFGFRVIEPLDHNYDREAGQFVISYANKYDFELTDANSTYRIDSTDYINKSKILPGESFIQIINGTCDYSYKLNVSIKYKTQAGNPKQDEGVIKGLC